MLFTPRDLTGFPLEFIYPIYMKSAWCGQSARSVALLSGETQVAYSLDLIFYLWMALSGDLEADYVLWSVPG